MSKISYFDNAATTFPKPECVYTTMDSFYREKGVNVGRGQYPLAREASLVVEKTRDQLRSLFHAPASTIVLTPSATIAMNMVLQGLDFSNIHNVYITPFEHNAVTRVLNYLKIKNDFELRELYVNHDSLEYDLQKIASGFALGKPDLVIMSQVSNVCGLIAPIGDISLLAKKYNATVVVDTAQSAGLIDLNVISSHIDFTIFAGHKALYGPLGIGGIVINSDVPLTPIIYGGTGVDSKNPYMPNDYPAKLEPASMNIESIVGLSTALTWIDHITIQKLFEKEEENKDRLLKLFSTFGNITIIAKKCASSTIGVVSCLFDGYTPEEVGLLIGKGGVAMRSGLHCSPSAHRFLGTYPAGTVRFSPGWFTCDKDFSTLENVLSSLE